MTREEAIKWIDALNIYLSICDNQSLKDGLSSDIEKTIKTLDMAIEALEYIEKHKDILDLVNMFAELGFDTNKIIWSAQEWIPCSERPPEEKGEYFITCTYGVDIAEYNPNMYGDSIWTKGNILFKHNSVIAWMPLPESYKVESENKE